MGGKEFERPLLASAPNRIRLGAGSFLDLSEGIVLTREGHSYEWDKGILGDSNLISKYCLIDTEFPN